MTRLGALERAARTDVRAFSGKWVAVRDGKVLVSGTRPTDVVRRARRIAGGHVTVFRVRPRSERSAWVY